LRHRLARPRRHARALLALLPVLAGLVAAGGARAADTLVVRVPTDRSMARMLAEADSAVRARGGARADDAQLFLSWNAPWGGRRAQRAHEPACGDSLRGDTLYLCMRTGRAAEKFTGFTARLLVHATGTDTLGAWWHMQGKGANPGALRVEWAALQDWPGAVAPFRVQGQGLVQLTPERAVARLDMVYAVPLADAVPVRADAIYTLGRIVLLHRPERRLAGCDRPVVIEWQKGSLAFGLKDEPSVARGERFATFGGPYVLADAFRGPRVPAWKPPDRR